MKAFMDLGKRLSSALADFDSKSRLAAPVTSCNFMEFSEPVQRKALINLRERLSSALAAGFDSKSPLPASAEEFGGVATEQRNIYLPGAYAKPNTTVLVKHIPTCYTQKCLQAELQALGFSGCYDFIHLLNRKRGTAIMGFKAFINFTCHAAATRAMKVFSSHVWQKF